MKIDPSLDLVLDREVPVAPAIVWAAWTQPEHLKKWFCPRPWQVTECEIDLRPGGKFRTVMRGPDGPAMDNTGCYLEVVPGQRLVWTGALGEGFRPNDTSAAPFVFSAILTLTPKGAGTAYRAHVMHATAAAAKAHEQMGFTAGWGKALEQLVEAAQAGQITA